MNRELNIPFAWQLGYSVFSVSQSKLPDVESYIARQKEHHAKVSMQDELRALLDRHRIEYRPDDI